MAHIMKTPSTSLVPKETQPLNVPQHTDRVSPTSKNGSQCFRIRWRFINISEKGAIFMIVLNTFFIIATISCLESSKFKNAPQDHYSKWLIIPSTLALMLFSIVGLVCDCYFGRYEVLQGSIYILLFGIVMKAIDVMTLEGVIWFSSIAITALSIATHSA